MCLVGRDAKDSFGSLGFKVSHSRTQDIPQNRCSDSNVNYSVIKRHETKRSPLFNNGPTPSDVLWNKTLGCRYFTSLALSFGFSLKLKEYVNIDTREVKTPPQIHFFISLYFSAFCFVAARRILLLETYSRLY